MECQGPGEWGKMERAPTGRETGGTESRTGEKMGIGTRRERQGEPSGAKRSRDGQNRDQQCSDGGCAEARRWDGEED